MVCKRIAKTVFAALLICICLMSSASAEKVGTVPWLLTATSDKNALYRQCSLGDAAADALRKYLGTDIAIVNGGDLLGNLQPGDTTTEDLNACLREGRTLAVAEITGAELYQIMESALSHTVITDKREFDAELSAHGAFPQISGFRVSYNPGWPAGERISRMTFQDKPVEKDDRLTLAATVYMLDGGYDLPEIEGYTARSETLTDVMAAYIGDGMDDYSISHARVNAMEVHSQQHFSRYAIFTAVAICAILFVLLVPLSRHRKQLPAIPEEESEAIKEIEEARIESEDE